MHGLLLVLTAKKECEYEDDGNQYAKNNDHPTDVSYLLEISQARFPDLRPWSTLLCRCWSANNGYSSYMNDQTKHEQSPRDEAHDREELDRGVIAADATGMVANERVMAIEELELSTEIPPEK